MICLIIEDKFYTDKLIIKFKGKKFKAQSSKEKKFKENEEILKEYGLKR